MGARALPILGTLAAKNQITIGDILTTGAASGKVIKADGASGATYGDDLTGAAPGGITVANVDADFRSRLEKTSVSTLDGTTNGNWTTPDANVFDVTATLDLRAYCLPDTWVTTLGQSLVSKWNATGNQKSWRFLIAPTGFLEVTTTTAGATSILTAGTKLMQQNVPPGVPVWLRAVIDPTGGASSHVLATFYWTAVANPGTSDWIQLEQATAATGGATFSGSAQVMVGGDESSGGNQSFFKGKMYKAQIRDGSGTLIEDFDTSAVPVGGTTMTGTNGHVWTAHSGSSVSTINIDMANLQNLFGWFDTKAYGAKSDLTRSDVTMTSGSPTATATGSFTFLASNGDAGKLIRVRGAGATLFSGSDGVMATGGFTNNRFTSAGSTFTQAVVGRIIQVTGAGTAAAILTAKILGVESATQLRLATPCATSVSGVAWTINEDLCSTITASTASTATLADNSGVAVTATISHHGTDDSTAIQAAIDACETASGSGGTVYHAGASALGSAVFLTEATTLTGSGSRGYSRTLGLGTTRLMLLGRGIRGVVCGPKTCKLGVNGSITSGAAVLTDPNGQFAAGDVGKNIIVYGAGTQTGSTDGIFLNTTIASFSSATSVTLTANAGTTLAGGAVYSLTSGAGYAGGLVGPCVKNLHVMGGSDSICGVHLINCSESIVEEVCASDIGPGIGIMVEGGPSTGFENQTELRSCYMNDCRIGLKQDRGTVFLTGQCFIDGNSNRVDTPSVNTYGVDCQTVVLGGTCAIQSFDTCLRCDGRGGSSGVWGNAWRCEAFNIGFDIASDGGSTSAKGMDFGFYSMGSSNSGGGHGLKLRSGVPGVVYRPGYWITTDVNQYDLCDATALAKSIRVDDHTLTQTYAASNVSTDRTYDANSTTLDELADVVGTLISDLRAQGVVL